MPALSTTASNNLLDKEFGATNYTPPATLYIALYSSAPANDGSGGTELSGDAYARVAVTNNTTNWPNASAKVKSNGTAITFPQATADWVEAEAVVIFDASSGGNVRAFGYLDEPAAITNGQTAEFEAGDLEIVFA
jgi:hypothetical protein